MTEEEYLAEVERPRYQMSFYKLDTGEIIGSMYATFDEFVANTPEGCSAIEGIWSGAKYYVLDAAPVERPTIELPTITANLIKYTVPLGTTIKVVNEYDETFEGDYEPLQIDDPGSYRVWVTPPFPYVPRYDIVEIT